MYISVAMSCFAIVNEQVKCVANASKIEQVVSSGAKLVYFIDIAMQFIECVALHNWCVL